MRYWLLRRPPPANEINPNFRSVPWDYDKVFVNARLTAGDIAYLIAAYNDLYGWGHIEKKQSYQDNELNRRAYRITITRPVLQLNLVSAEEVRRPPELGRLFETSVNLVELNASQVNVLNGLLASKGVITPPYKLADEFEKPTVCAEFPKLEVPQDARVWMSAAYACVKAGRKVDPQQLLVELWSQIPDFNYKSIDPRLMQFGVELTLLGILQIDPKTELFVETDQVIRFIKQTIQREPKVERVTAEEVSEATELQEERVALIFSLMSHLGHFWNGAAGSGNVRGYTSITIKDEHVKREYLKYERLEPLLERCSKTGLEEPLKASEEPPFVHSVLDWKFGERLEAALNYIGSLSADDVLEYDTERLTKTVERFAIELPTVRTDKRARDERMAELEDLTIDRKTGDTGHCIVIPIEGEAEWFQEINMQTVVTDGHPLAFLDEDRSWIFIKLTVSLSDPEGTLKRKLDERLVLVAEYATYVSERIIEFNKELADKMTEDLNKRKKAIQKGKAEADAVGLPTAYNPKHAETAVRIERLMENLNARFTRASNQPPISDDIRDRRIKNEMSDLHQDAVTIAKYMYENKFIGSRSVTLSKLRETTKLPEEDFDIADEYLLGSRICDGTAGGDAGQRWLTPDGVNFVKMQLDREGSVLISDQRQQSSIDVFVSHSSKDAAMAKTLVVLLRAALNIPADRIRCTSVDGYRLPVGASTDDQLRVELRASKVFLGLITKTSIESTYVLFELGARWGASLQLAPVLVSSRDKGLLRGPLSGVNALACDSRSQILQLVDDIASHLGVTAARPASYQEYVDAVLVSSAAADGQQPKDVNSVKGALDFERMAKHVENYFAAKRFRQVGFESIRKYINSGYSDQMLFEMIDRFPERFRRITLRGNKPAVGRPSALGEPQARP